MVACLRLLLGSLLALAVSATWARADFPDLDATWRWAEFGTDSGLPALHTQLLAETHAGTIWAGTQAGLAWYDGFTWRPVGPDAGVPAAMPACLYATPAGDVVTVIGGSIYLGDRSGFSTLPLDLDGDTLRVTAAAPRGDAIVALAADQVFIRAAGAWTRIPGPPHDPYSRRNAAPPLALTGAGNIYLRTTGGLYRLDDRDWTLAKAGWGIRDLAESRAGGLLLSVAEPREAVGTWEWQPPSPPRRVPPLFRDAALALGVSANGDALAVGPAGKAWYRRDGEWQAVSGARFRDAYAAWFASNGDLWVGAEGGLSRFWGSLRRWSRPSMRAGAQSSYVASLLRTADAALWIGSEGGLEVIAPQGHSEWFGAIGDTPLRVVTGLAQDSSGAVWVGSGQAFDGVLCRRGDTWSHLGADGDMGRVHAIDLDGRGQPWFLTLDRGAWVLGPDGPEPWAHSAGLIGQRVYSFADAGEHGLWFGCLGGMSRWRDGAWTHWDMDDGLPEVFCLAVGQDSRLWFGHRVGERTFGYVGSDDRVRFVPVHGAGGNAEIWDMALSPQGAVWLATQSGLRLYREGAVLPIGPAMGLMGRSLWPLALTGDHLTVGTQGSGAVVLDLAEGSLPPPRVLLHVDGHGEGGRDLRVRVHPYGGIQPPASVPIRYAIDDEGPWSPWTAERAIDLSHLGPGKHVVRVQAIGAFGNLDPNGAEIRFSVPQPLHLRPEFALPVVSLSALALVLLLVSLHRRAAFHRALRTNLALERLLNETMKMETEGDWERLVAAFGRELRTQVRAHGVSINLVQPDGTVTAYMDRPQGPGITRFPLADAPLLLEVMESGRSQYRATRTEIASGTDERRLLTTRVQSVADAPFSGGTIAMNSRKRRAFSPEDLRVLERFALVLSEAHQRLQDLQERARNAEQFQQNQRLQMINRLATGVAHEVNNPLTHIIGYSELLLKRPLGDRERHYATTIRDAGQRAGAITERLVAYNRRQQSSSQKFSLSDLAAETADLVRYGLEMVRLHLETDIEPRAYVRAHPGEIQQALITLLHNARDAVAEGSGAGLIRLQLRCADGLARLDVVDDGPGVAPDAVERLFEPFNTTKPVGAGTGLGLSECRALLNRNGGQLQYVPSDRGARFSIQLPLHRSSVAEPPQENQTHDIANTGA